MKKINFDLLYNDNYDYILSLVKRNINRHEDAEDITQNIFMNILKYMYKFEEERANIRTLLITIMRNEIIDFYRSAHRQRSLSMSTFRNENGDDKFQIPNESNDSNDNYIIMYEQMKSAIGTLRENHKQIATYFFVEKKKIREIAEIMQISIGTIKGTLNRIKSKIKVYSEGKILFE